MAIMVRCWLSILGIAVALSACTPTNDRQSQAVHYPVSHDTTGGSTGGPWNGVPTPPEAPKAYALPGGAIRVTNATELKNALDGTSARDIILANGTYDNGSAFNPAAGHRLWAENLGGAVLTAGIALDDDSAGFEIHGLKLQINSRAKAAFNDSAIEARGNADRVKIMDSWLIGDKRNVKWGFMSRGGAYDGLVMQRLVVDGFTWDGIRIDSWIGSWASPACCHPDANPRVLMTDINVSNIKHPDPNCCKGIITTEVGIWLGTPGTIERVKMRKIDWTCIEPVQRASHVIMRDLDLDDCGQVAIWVEHFTEYSTFERFWLGPNTRTGIAIEWGGDWGWKNIGDDNVYQDGTIESYRFGVINDACNEKQTVRRVKFENQCAAAIIDIAAVGFGECGPKINTYVDNDYSGIDPGAKQITTQHHNSFSCN